MERKPDSGAGDASASYWTDSIEVVRAQLDGLMNHSTSGVAIYEAVREGEDFLFVGFNRAAEEIEQIKRAEIIGRSVLEVFPGVREFGLLDIFRRVWQTGQPEWHPISVYRDDRLSGWRQNYVCKLPDGRIMAVYNDVTQDKHSELAARMSEQCFRAIANYTYDWEVWVGPTGRVLWTNPAVVRVTGYTVKELVAMPNYPEPIVYEQDRERIMRAFRSALKGGTGNDVDFRVRHKDGKTLWVEMSWQPIHDESSNSLGHRESIRDITARKKAEHALQQTEREKGTILDNLIELVVHQDRDLNVLWANRAACASVGRTREQVIGQRCYQLWGEGDEPCKDCPVAKAIEMGCRTEVEKTTRDGRTWVIQAAPMRDEEGHVVGGAEIALDVTKYKRTEEALSELRREYRQLEAELDAFRGGSDEAV
jgi:PAS domain S-box-containing protein